MYELPDLLRLWERGELTAEQGVGQLVQHVITLSQRLGEVEKPGVSRAGQPERPGLGQGAPRLRKA